MSPQPAPGPDAPWRAVFALPNLQLPDPATPPDQRGNFAAYDLGYLGLNLGSSYLAVAHPADPRVQADRARGPGINQLLDGFRDVHGESVQPAILLVRADAPGGIDLDAVRAFRNALALATVLPARVASVRGRSVMTPMWADVFDLYPAQIDRRGQLLFESPAAHILGEFRGPLVATTAPYLHRERQPILVGHFLHHALAAAWRRRFERSRALGTWEGRALFRSLELAYAAASVPVRNGASMHDYGVQVGLWISALEVLVRTNDKKASEERVRSLLAAAPWSRAMRWVRRRSFRTVRYPKGKRRVERFTPAGRALHDLYRARNDFLHGNAVAWDTLTRWGRRRAPTEVSLPAGAAVIYRVALRSFLAARYQFDETAATDDGFWEVSDDMNCVRALRAMLLGPDAADDEL